MTFEIRNECIAKDLLAQGFTINKTSPGTIEDASTGIWIMDKPIELSNNKARKIVSTCIQLFTTAKELVRVKNKYQRLVDQINFLNSSRQ